MQNKLKLNWEYYFDNNTQICYAKNHCGDKALKHLQLYFCANSLISFKIVDNLFTKLKEVYSNLYYKKYIIEKFKELIISSRFFNVFDLKLIKLAAKLEFTKEILLYEFMDKLSPHMQNQMNFRLEYPDNIKDLVAHCQKIYDQILATNWIQSNTKLANTKVVNTPTRFFLPLSQTTLPDISGYCRKYFFSIHK